MSSEVLRQADGTLCANALRQRGVWVFEPLTQGLCDWNIGTRKESCKRQGWRGGQELDPEHHFK